MLFFFNDTATTEIYTLSLHDALPIYLRHRHHRRRLPHLRLPRRPQPVLRRRHHVRRRHPRGERSEEHTSELQSRQYLVCRLLLEKKNAGRWEDDPHVLYEVQDIVDVL